MIEAPENNAVTLKVITAVIETHTVDMLRSTRTAGAQLGTRQVYLTITTKGQGAQLPINLYLLHESWDTLDDKPRPVVSVSTGASGDYIFAREYVGLDDMNLILQGIQAGTAKSFSITYDGDELPKEYDPGDIQPRSIVQLIMR